MDNYQDTSFLTVNQENIDLSTDRDLEEIGVNSSEVHLYDLLKTLHVEQAYDFLKGEYFTYYISFI